MCLPRVTLLAALFAFTACDNVLPQGLEDRIRDGMREAEERERMAAEVAVFETEKGRFVVRLLGAEAPRSVMHVRKLIDAKFYDGVRVHRSVKSPLPFIVQFGDAVTKGKPGEDFVWEAEKAGKPVAGAGASPEYVKFEPSKRKHAKGVVGLAHRESDDRGGSQLYITLAPQPQLDGKFTVVGEIIEGLEAAEKLERGDVIKRVKLVEDERAEVTPQ